jgi:hypothetical protein
MKEISQGNPNFMDLNFNCFSIGVALTHKSSLSGILKLIQFLHLTDDQTDTRAQRIVRWLLVVK